MRTAGRALIICAVVLMCVIGFTAPGFATSYTLNLKTLPSTTLGGYYVGEIGGTVNYVTGLGSSPTEFVCDDFLTHTYVPSSFAVNVSTIPELTYAKFRDQEGALFKYKEVAWLRTQMDTASPADIGPIQFAIWKIFTPTTPTPTGKGDAIASWLAAADYAVSTLNLEFSQMRIYTPVGVNSNQEFISGLDAQPVPLPTSAALLIPGVLGLAVLRKRIAK